MAFHRRPGRLRHGDGRRPRTRRYHGLLVVPRWRWRIGAVVIELGRIGAILLTRPPGTPPTIRERVWPWLFGPYAAAAVRAGLDIGELFLGIEAHLPEFGLGSVSETADGEPPHTATGCPFQVWSVGELLRVRRF